MIFVISTGNRSVDIEISDKHLGKSPEALARLFFVPALSLLLDDGSNGTALARALAENK